MEKAVIIVGSSRKNGNTAKIASAISHQFSVNVVNLSNYEISYYDYESKNSNDDFLPLVKSLIEKYETFVFATPVYWYNMSGTMKVFFDRITDLLRIDKETGRKLRGKNFAVFSNSGDDQLDYDFYLPFRKSAEYLGMNYIGNQHFNAENFHIENKIEIEFLNNIQC